MQYGYVLALALGPLEIVLRTFRNRGRVFWFKGHWGFSRFSPYASIHFYPTHWRLRLTFNRVPLTENL